MTNLIFNYIIIVAVIGIVALVIWMYIKNISNLSDMDELEEIENTSIESLIDIVADSFAKTVRMNLRELNLSREELRKEERKKEEHRVALKEAAYGNHSAKKFLIAAIRNIITGPAGGIDETNIDDVIPFSNVAKLKPRDKFEILMAIYQKEYQRDGFAKMVEEYELDKPKKVENGGFQYKITADEIDYIYRNTIKDIHLSYDEKLKIICNRIFSQFKGFGVIDTLLDTSVDEIDAGVSGIPKGSYDIVNVDMRNVPFTYESIWVMFKGNNIHLSFLSFESQNELVRVCKNICKFNAKEVLSIKNGKIISTMMDGSRIVVVRPPFASSYAFFLRKFDSTPGLRPEELITDENSHIPIGMMKWFTKGFMNIAISGAMGSGKSTFLKGCVSFMDPASPIRVHESAFELNLNYAYPDRNIEAFQETDSITSQEGLDLIKKTNAYITIRGEIDSPYSASWAMQTANVASRQAFFSHHGADTKSMVYSLRDNLLAAGGYTNEKAAEETVVKAVNIDCHFEKTNGHRYIQYITEIIPNTERDYPVKNLDGKTGEALIEATSRNESEFYKRMTDRENFIVRKIVSYNDGKYVLENLPTEQTIKKIEAVLSTDELAEFRKDMESFRKMLANKKGA